MPKQIDQMRRHAENAWSEAEKRSTRIWRRARRTGLLILTIVVVGGLGWLLLPFAVVILMANR